MKIHQFAFIDGTLNRTTNYVSSIFKLIFWKLFVTKSYRNSKTNKKGEENEQRKLNVKDKVKYASYWTQWNPNRISSNACWLVGTEYRYCEYVLNVKHSLSFSAFLADAMETTWYRQYTVLDKWFSRICFPLVDSKKWKERKRRKTK